MLEQGASAPGAYPDDLRGIADAYLEELSFPGAEAVPGLVEAMRYSLLAGGKRIRPVLAMATAEALGGEASDVLPFSASVEMIHTYSLIHDDLPAMDDDDFRRGMPTLHKERNEAVAILAGDCLYAEAFAHLLTHQSGPPEAVSAAAAELARATGVDGMVGGQFIDVEEMVGPGIAGLELLHGLKTGRLIRASADCVNLLMGIQGEKANAIKGFSSELGVLFQIVDDILDVTGSDSDLGKPAGSDERQGKRTFVTEVGLDGARQLAAERHSSALSCLASMGDEATRLRAIADHVWTRSS